MNNKRRPNKRSKPVRTVLTMSTLARPNVTEPPPGPRTRAWIRGVVIVNPISGLVSVGRELLAHTFVDFDGKNVKVTIEVLP